MANTKTKEDVDISNIEDRLRELNMDKKVKIINRAPWNVGFPNRATSGDTSLSPSAETLIRREEIAEQVSAGNKLFGIDAWGSHATIYIDDEDMRKYLEFDSLDGTRQQNVISESKVKELFEIKTQGAFEKAVKEAVITRAEKAFVLKAIDKLKLNDHNKIKFCEEYCKFTIF